MPQQSKKFLRLSRLERTESCIGSQRPIRYRQQSPASQRSSLRFAFPQRAPDAFKAAARRCSGVIVISRRFPPTWPPLRPIADMYAERLAGTGTGGSGEGSAVECSTTHLASWLGSRGLLPLPTVIKQSSHNPIAKRRLWKSKLTHYPLRGALDRTVRQIIQECPG